MGTNGQVYGDKLKGISEEKAADAAQHALALCQARSIPALDSATYNGRFVSEFMARLGLKDVKQVPGRNTLAEIHQRHLAQKEEETLNVQHETYINDKKGESDDEEKSRGSDDDDDKSDGFVGSDSDDDVAAAAPTLASVVLRPARPRRGAPKSAREKLAE